MVGSEQRSRSFKGREVRVLHLGLNIASAMSTAITLLRAIGVECRGIVRYSHHYTSDGELQCLPGWISRRQPLDWAKAEAQRYTSVLSAIAWADVVHWHFGITLLPRALDVTWASMLGKPGLVEFSGSDIRVAEVEKRDNPYFTRFAPEDYCKELTRDRSLRVQALFSKAGLACLTYTQILPYVERDLFQNCYLVRQRIPLHKFSPRFPNPSNQVPVIVHAPSRLDLKGTRFVLAAIDELRPKLQFDFRLVNDVPHEAALSQIACCDIFVDQLIGGDHGTAAVEAMAFGKPVVCYIKPSMLEQHAKDLPIVNANPDNFVEVLKRLMQDGAGRREIGERSRSYVEKYHSPRLLADQLVEIYQDIAVRRGMAL